MKKITVFTPTYNRAYCLDVLYKSLCTQTSKDFLWLVIDDGSTDNTKELIANWQAENKIEIQYFYKKNGGMHTAHNVAYQNIDTELNICIDSDDSMPKNAIERILFLWETYGNERFAGIIGLDETVSGKIIGTSFPENLKSCKYHLLAKDYHVFGDKKIIYRTEITKKIKKYPEFPGEKFVPLFYPIIIDKAYDLLCFNEVFCIVDYKEDGSTLNIYNQYYKNPKGFSYSRTIEMAYFSKWSLRFKSAIHYVATSLLSRDFSFLLKSNKKIMTLFAIPFGIILYFFILKNKNKKRDISKYVN